MTPRIKIQLNSTGMPVLPLSMYRSILMFADAVLADQRQHGQMSHFNALDFDDAVHWLAALTAPDVRAKMLAKVEKRRVVAANNYRDKQGRKERNLAWLRSKGYEPETDELGRFTGRLTPAQWSEMRRERMALGHEKQRGQRRGAQIPSLSPGRRYSLVQLGKMVAKWESWVENDDVAKVLSWIFANEAALRAHGRIPGGSHRTEVDIPPPPGSAEVLGATLGRMTGGNLPAAPAPAAPRSNFMPVSPGGVRHFDDNHFDGLDGEYLDDVEDDDGKD
jgi:hypothetical protein